jgi:hypothetical protein
MDSKSNGGAMVRAEAPRAALALTGSVRLDGMADVWKLATALAEARGFVPDQYAGKPAALAAVILTGIELGLPPMMAMREIHVIKGRPTLSATLMLSLARRAGVVTRWIHADNTKATIGVTVPGLAEQTMTFAEADARAAGVWGQGNWKSYPAPMLRARCASAAIRAFCPEVIGGSVYESESGELTDGVPSSVAVALETAPAAPIVEAKVIRRKLSDCTTPEELHAWCRENSAAVRDGGDRAFERVMMHAVWLGVGDSVVRQWLGFEAPVEDDSGELAEDPPVAGGAS